MSDLNNEKIPTEAIQARKVVEELLGSTIVGVYLFGSAVTSGLRIHSDVDVLVVVNQCLTEENRRKLTDRLMPISGKIGNSDSVRPLEVTVINHGDVVPWRFPPKNEFIYGEWLRDEFENGQIQEPTYDPDLAIVLAQVRKNSVSLFGPDASEVLEPVPMTHIRRAIMDCLPGLIAGIKGDERNVILTLARMWLTIAVGEISSKDIAAEWVIPQLPKEHATLLNVAKKAYRGEVVDKWEGLDSEVLALVNHMKSSIESYVSI
ncbi:aminoglycoside nucleotidyltransferase ANT9 [Brevibacillus reuszeri]|uniref:Spectinomycin 9-adenylyltransferase n=1 Tax=Brevibacillus reuszeri TaxID=54915 RepID=A0A0K9YQX7_9BACL|nr:aminoglycoside nucleotidyltransferase ANT(9) [Brevibacillus reuszeri]KNB70585.1 adenylyltransferase [Brevibacillus reuszeri]MED1861440.1 aminoglycoside nucleotidyltransferase ANT(9) [Brevibacillus reuszeri]GED69985.1 aminoglycoside nucleotidyltransferase ANT9 [Brevibacillus reuszeri]